MTQFTTILDQESGIQFGGVRQTGGEPGINPVNGLIVGYFRRGRFDKPMTITNSNIRGVLGHDARNPYYRMVQDALNEGVDSVQVLRIGANNPVPVQPSNPNPNPTPVPTPPVLDAPVELEKFDFAVIRYRWTSSGGTDLDTRTLITSPPRNNVVGWDRLVSDNNYLQWGGDNTGSGVEAVLIDVKALQQGFPDVQEFLIQIRALWFSSRGTGDVVIEFESYKNGSMSQNGYDFVSNGGQLVQKLSVTVNCDSTDRNGLAQLLATLAYNPYENSGQLF